MPVKGSKGLQGLYGAVGRTVIAGLFLVADMNGESNGKEIDNETGTGFRVGRYT